jgi:hypothetical protein
MAEAQRRSVWPKVLGIGCGVILLFVAVIAGALAWNWPRVSGMYHRASSMFAEMMQVQSALQTKYGGTVHVNARRGSDTDGTVLSVTLTNPSFLDTLNLDAPEAKQKALEIATAARDALAPDSSYAAYDVVLSRQAGSGMSVSTSTAFRFQPSELPARSQTPDRSRRP